LQNLGIKWKYFMISIYIPAYLHVVVMIWLLTI
jgi:hypothetical protein